jgi:hypothetical protein
MRRCPLNLAQSTSPRAATTSRCFASLNPSHGECSPRVSGGGQALLVRDSSVIARSAGADLFLNICGCFSIVMAATTCNTLIFAFEFN